MTEFQIEKYCVGNCLKIISQGPVMGRMFMSNMKLQHTQAAVVSSLGGITRLGREDVVVVGKLSEEFEKSLEKMKIQKNFNVFRAKNAQSEVTFG